MVRLFTVQETWNKAMKDNYKVNLIGNNLYREISLPADHKVIKVGTTAESDFRLHKDLFFENISLAFYQTDSCWMVSCADNLYIDAGDIRKLLSLKLENGQMFSVRYRNSELEVFKVEFYIDFQYERRKYERFVDVSKAGSFSIGHDKSCLVYLGSRYSQRELVIFKQQINGLEAAVKSSVYGFFVNGEKVHKTAKVLPGDFFYIADCVFYLDYQKRLWMEIRPDVQTSEYTDASEQKGYPAFKRNTRVKKELVKDEIEILDPPSKPQKQKTHILTELLPSFSMLLVSGAMASMGGSTMMIFSIMTAGISILTSILMIIQRNKDYKEEVKKREQEYTEYIHNKQTEITAFRDEERKKLEEIYPDGQTELNRVSMFSSELFDRESKDEDFLNVRLGTGDIEAERKINYKKQERLTTDDLQLLPEKISNEQKILKNAPVICSFKQTDAVGVIGTESRRFELMKIIVLDLVTRQFQSDFKLFFISEVNHGDKIEWLRFLPETNEMTEKRRFIATDEESKTKIFDYLYNILSQRKKDEENTHLIAFFYDDCGIQNHPLSKFISHGSELGITFVFFSEESGQIPQGCGYLIEAVEDNAAILVDTANEMNNIRFTYERISDQAMYDIVRKLAPVYTEEISLESALTSNISLFEMMNIFDVSDINLEKNWQQSDITKTIAVPIGVDKNGLVYLDIHDKAHGPHGLVAGTTGSGKSELLQTFILSAAALYHPYELSFIIIDFKGGGMANQFAKLPHMLGTITNIDGKEIDRSLRFIKAELQKRQRLFAEAGVNHIDKYIRKYKSGEIETPIPHLVLIVDEFAELRAEQPDFMKELVSAARIGRSLGVHLILATQKPNGQVDDQISSNSRFRLCLKVQTPEDSNDMLKTPIAAEIKEPGRAYIQVGNNEIFNLFQSAYSGASERIYDSGGKQFELYEVNTSGQRRQIYSKKVKKSVGKTTQLEAIVNYIHRQFEVFDLKKLPSVCLPPLSETYKYPEKCEFTNGSVDIGIYDDPDQQYQGSSWIDVDNKNTLIIGSSQNGKTNLVQLIIRTIAGCSMPEAAQFYIIDFGSMILKTFESLNHVGGVVCTSEDEKLKNLIKLLQEEIVLRKQKLLDSGVSSYSAYVEAGYTDLPHIYLIIENLTALLEMYFQDGDEALLGILRDSLAVGISVIVTNAFTNGITYRYISNFANKICFFCNDSGEYINVFDHVRQQPAEIPGRCIFEIDKVIYEAQTYLSFEGEKEIDRVKNIQAFIAETNSKSKSKAKQIPHIPERLTEEEFIRDYPLTLAPNECAIGLDYETIEPVIFSLRTPILAALCGGEQDYRNRWTAWLLKQLSRNGTKMKLSVFDDVARNLAFLRNDQSISLYTLDPSKMQDALGEWKEILEQRYEAMMDNRPIEGSNDLLVMIIQNNDAVKGMEDDYDLQDIFTEITTRYSNMGVFFIFTDYPNASISYSAALPLRAVKESPNVLYFGDLDNMKSFDVPYEYMKKFKKKAGKDDAYFIRENEITKVKLINPSVHS